jgi:glutathionyl-hydroquinone reductase
LGSPLCIGSWNSVESVSFQERTYLASSLQLTNDVGWRFVTPDESLPGENIVPDPINGVQNIRDLYLLANPNYSGRFSVPVLWDKKLKTIVSNESSEIIRCFETEFDGLIGDEFKSVKLVPEEARKQIDDMNIWIYVSHVLATQKHYLILAQTDIEKDDINNGV